MQAVVSTVGKFHSFHLARELMARNMLKRIFSGYPRVKLAGEAIPSSHLSTFPFLHAPYMAMPHRHMLGPWVNEQWEYWDRVTFGRFVASSIPECDVYSGMSASGLEAGRVIKRRGSIYVCDRGSAHIRTQDEILRREHDNWGIPYRGIDPRIIEREEKEYELADVITVPSHFAANSFADQGIDSSKVRTVPYGVDLARFAPRGNPDPRKFAVAFAGQVTLQKGVPHLLQAFRDLIHDAKELTFVGQADPNFLRWLDRKGLLGPDVRFTGPLSQHGLNRVLSQSDVLVLPSVQDGFGMVLAEAMASGCPVIATSSSGGPDLVSEGVDGFVIPPGSSEHIRERLEELAGNLALRQDMRSAALSKVQTLGGWAQYGDAMVSLFETKSNSRASSFSDLTPKDNSDGRLHRGTH